MKKLLAGFFVVAVALALMPVNSFADEGDGYSEIEGRFLIACSGVKLAKKAEGVLIVGRRGAVAFYPAEGSKLAKKFAAPLDVRSCSVLKRFEKPEPEPEPEED
jgi:hypothetical protein